MGITTHVSVKRWDLVSAEVHALKDWTKKALVKTGTIRLAASLRSPAAAILTYHSVRDDLDQDANWIGPGITHATEVFARHMELAAHKFHPVTLDDILLFLKGERELPRWAVAVTFDDGYLDNLEIAAPVLSRFGIAAAFYLTVGLIGRREAPWYSRVRHAFMTTKRDSWHSSWQERAWELSSPAARDRALLVAYDLCAPLVGKSQQQAVSAIEQELDVEPVFPERRLMMNWEEARALRCAGHVVGSHTVTHPNVAHVKDDAIQAELVESKRVLEEHLGEPVAHFSYPHPALLPQWNEKTVAATREAGYASAVTTTKGPVRRGANPLTLARVNAPRPDYEFLWNLERAFLRA